MEYFDKLSFIQRKINETDSQVDNKYANFFSREHYLDYIANFPNLRFVQEKALDYLFTANGELIERCQKAIEINRTCFEAFFIMYSICDSLNFYYESLDIQKLPLDIFNDYELNDAVNIKMLIAHYYSDIFCFTQSINNLDEIGMLIGQDKVISKKILAYNFLEDYKSIYDLYNEVGFDNPKDYIVSMVCFLKTRQEDLAHEIYDDMLEKFEYADFISKPQDLSAIKNSNAEEMMKAMESCFELMESVPYFFSWTASHVESKSGLPN